MGLDTNEDLIGWLHPAYQPLVPVSFLCLGIIVGSQRKDHERLKPLSLWPLSPEEALHRAMQAPPNGSDERAKIKRSKKKRTRK